MSSFSANVRVACAPIQYVCLFNILTNAAHYSDIEVSLTKDKIESFATHLSCIEQRSVSSFIYQTLSLLFVVEVIVIASRVLDTKLMKY